jgi:hypothetical protein
MFQKYYLHDKLLVRFGSLLAFTSVVFLGAWFVSFYLLPEGILRGKSAAQALAGNDLAGGSLWLEWLRIFALNLGAMVIIVAVNLFRTGGNLPLGYVTVVMHAMIFSIFIGTNSFTLSQGGKLPPSLEIFASSGIYEMAAYVLAATSTASISKYRLVGKWGEKINAVNNPSVVRQRNVGLALSIAILAVACGWEAVRVATAIPS